jgi:hypothetical protein
MMDHLVLGVPDLEQGIDLVEQKPGARNFGGRHPGRGTHNRCSHWGTEVLKSCA